ncbi:MAG: hypothetical protein LC802_17295 [Acidobacteria bacterium]|nr:hypothetical protein [Acidobacteriota bacterium]
MRRTILLVTVVAALIAATVVVFADSRNYTPPAEKGDIYVVVRYRTAGSMGGMYAQRTSLSVAWGRFNRSGSVNPPQVLPGRAIAAKGFVLKLRHTKNDSVQLTVETDGRIVQGPYQGAPPSEWNDGDYKRVEW